MILGSNVQSPILIDAHARAISSDEEARIDALVLSKLLNREVGVDKNFATPRYFAP